MSLVEKDALTANQHKNVLLVTLVMEITMEFVSHARLIVIGATLPQNALFVNLNLEIIMEDVNDADYIAILARVLQNAQAVIVDMGTHLVEHVKNVKEVVKDVMHLITVLLVLEASMILITIMNVFLDGGSFS